MRDPAYSVGRLASRCQTPTEKSSRMRLPIHRSTVSGWRRRLALVAVTVAAGAALVPAQAGAQATRTWVSGVGDDVNPCSRTAPCKTLAGAISKTATGGEINAIDPGGFGAVTITKAITIDLSSTLGGVLNAGTNGIIVNTTTDPDAQVVLRGLDILGSRSGATPTCTYGGTAGVRVLQAGSVRIEDTRIRQQNQAGVQVVPTAGNPTVVLDGVSIGETCGPGVNIAPGPGQSVDALVRNTTITNSGTGVHVGAGGHVRLSGSSIFGNATGVATDGGGILDAYGDHQILGNDSDGSPTNLFGLPDPITVPGPTTVVTVPVPVPGPPVLIPGEAKAPAAKRCTVPSVVGLKTSAARKKLEAAGCTLGTQTARKTKKSKQVGRVVSQKVKAGTSVADGAPVAVTVGKRAAR